jgi:hypothetical protein
VRLKRILSGATHTQTLLERSVDSAELELRTDEELDALN